MAPLVPRGASIGLAAKVFATAWVYLSARGTVGSGIPTTQLCRRRRSVPVRQATACRSPQCLVSFARPRVWHRGVVMASSACMCRGCGAALPDRDPGSNVAGGVNARDRVDGDPGPRYAWSWL